jgi:TPP-dependent pyruvate/acetoin dehydrogenase alpha subunit
MKSGNGQGGKMMELSNDKLLLLYTNMVRSRKADEFLVKALAKGIAVSFFHSGQGEEAISVGSAAFLRDDDYVYYHHRSHGIGWALSKVGPEVLKPFLAEHYAKDTGFCHGVSGYHVCIPEKGMLGQSGHLGATFTMGMGWGLAAKKNGRGQVVVAAFGDGTSNRGTLHEGMNMAALWKLPIVWVCHNNQFAFHMPIKDAYVREDIADLAAGYDTPGVVVDGQDVLAVHEAVQAGVARAREGKGPSLVECKTFRIGPHSEGLFHVSHCTPVPEDEIAAWKKRDPIKLLGERLLNQGIMTKADIETIDQQVTAEVAEAQRFAVESPDPDPAILTRIIYADYEEVTG